MQDLQLQMKLYFQVYELVRLSGLPIKRGDSRHIKNPPLSQASGIVDAQDTQDDQNAPPTPKTLLKPVMLSLNDLSLNE